MERLIVALDVPGVSMANVIVEKLPQVTLYKVGLELMLAGGEPFVRSLISRGKQVFLDLKMDDIGRTVERAVRVIREWGPMFLSVRGEPDTIRAAQIGRNQAPYPLIYATTTLSHRESAYPINDQLERIVEASPDGLIVSGPQIRSVHQWYPWLPIISPGIRLDHQENDDHKRTATPRAAICAGAMWLVVGRPITEAQDPVAIANKIITEIEIGEHHVDTHPVRQTAPR